MGSFAHELEGDEVAGERNEEPGPVAFRRTRPLGGEREPAECRRAAGALAQGEIGRGEGGFAQHAPLDGVPGLPEVGGGGRPAVDEGRRRATHRRRREIGDDPGEDRAGVAVGGRRELGEAGPMACRAGAEPEEVEPVGAGHDADAADLREEVDGPDVRPPDPAHREALVERGERRAPAVDGQLGDAGLGRARLVRVTVRPILDEVDRRPIGQLHEGVGEPLPEPPLAQGRDQRAGRGPEPLEEPALGIGSGAGGDEPHATGDREDLQVAVRDGPRRRPASGDDHRRLVERDGARRGISRPVVRIWPA